MKTAPKFACNRLVTISSHPGSRLVVTEYEPAVIGGGYYYRCRFEAPFAPYRENDVVTVHESALEVFSPDRSLVPGLPVLEQALLKAIAPIARAMGNTANAIQGGDRGIDPSKVSFGTSGLSPEGEPTSVRIYYSGIPLLTMTSHKQGNRTLFELSC